MRRSALAAARAHLEREGAPTFTLRSLAGELGIAHPSLYHHFAGRDAVVDALARSGFEELLAVERRLRDAHREPVAALLAVGHGVVAFARDHPALYRLMFGPEVVDRKASDEALAAALEAPLRLVAGLVDEGQRAGALRDGDPLLLAAALWAATHGTALLVLDGRLGVLGEQRAGALVDLALHVALDGVRAR